MLGGWMFGGPPEKRNKNGSAGGGGDAPKVCYLWNFSSFAVEIVDQL
jgi:hypothetical protein